PRDAYAALGAAQAFALDRLYPGRKARAIPGGQPLEALLRAAVEGRAGVPVRLADLPLATVGVGGGRWLVRMARGATRWTSGLQGVASLGGVDGLLFVFPEDIDVPFWTRGAVIPLDISFFDAAGGWLASYSMPLCTQDPCPVYGPGRPYRYALETVPGRLPDGLPAAGLDLSRRCRQSRGLRPDRSRAPGRSRRAGSRPNRTTTPRAVAGTGRRRSAPPPARRTRPPPSPRGRGRPTRRTGRAGRRPTPTPPTRPCPARLGRLVTSGGPVRRAPNDAPR